MGALGRRNDGSVADKRVVDTRVWNQVRLELVQVHIQSTVEPQRRRDGADDLSNEAVEVLVGWPRNIQVAAADIVDRLVVDQKGAVGILDSAVRRQHGVVRLNDSGRDARAWVDGKFEFALLAVVGCDALEYEGTKARAGATAKRVENQEALEAAAVVYSLVSVLLGPRHPLRRSRLCRCRRRLTRNASDLVDDAVDHFFADSVVAAGVVVGGIFLSTDEQLRVEELAVTARTNLVDGGRIEVAEDGARHVFAAAGLAEESLEGARVTDVLGDVFVGLSVGAQAVLEEVQLPGTVAKLAARLAEVKMEDLVTSQHCQCPSSEAFAHILECAVEAEGGLLLAVAGHWSLTGALGEL